MNPTTNEFWVKRLFGEKNILIWYAESKAHHFLWDKKKHFMSRILRKDEKFLICYFNDRTSEGEKTPLLKHRTNGHIHTSEKKKTPKVKSVYMLGKLYIFRDGLRTCVHGSSFSGFSIYIFQITRVQFTPPRLLELLFFSQGFFNSI